MLSNTDCRKTKRPPTDIFSGTLPQIHSSKSRALNITILTMWVLSVPFVDPSSLSFCGFQKLRTASITGRTCFVALHSFHVHKSQNIRWVDMLVVLFLKKQKKWNTKYLLLFKLYPTYHNKNETILQRQSWLPKHEVVLFWFLLMCNFWLK